MSHQPATSPSKEIWGIIKETQKNIRETQKNIKEISAEQKKFQAEQKKFQAEQKEFRKESQAEREKSRKEFQAEQKKIQAEREKSRKEFQAEQKEFRKEFQAIQKETERQIQKIGGRFNQRWGALVESLVEGKLVQIFQDLKIDITQTHTRSRVEWRKPEGSVERTEFDIIVANGTEAVVVEVKTALTPKDVRDFLSHVKIFKKYLPRYKTEKIYGAVAYLTVESKADFLAEEEGLFLIRATGDSASLVNRDGFQPKVFS